jgi:hypothetical protein
VVAHLVEFLVRVLRVVRELLVDVAARRERFLAGTRDHDAADRIVGLRLLHRMMQFLLQRAVHRVEFLWPIEREDRHAIFHVDKNVFVSHVCLSECVADKSSQIDRRR